MKNVKRIVALILSVVLLCGLCAVFAGCSYDETIKNLQQQVEELQTQLETQQGTINQQQEKLTEQQNKITLQQAKIEALERKVQNLTYRIEELEQSLYGGKFYGLETAYNKGFLTSDDLQIIADYRNGVVPNEEVLSDNVAAVIKRAWAAREATTEDNVMIHYYYGTYNGSVVVVIDRKDALYPPFFSSFDYEIGGVTFTFNLYVPQIYVWKFNNEIGE